jgi:type IV pilus assembly protein PilA
MKNARIALIAGLALTALGSCSDREKYKSMAAVASGLSMASTVKTFVSAFYDETGRLPSSNAEAHVGGVPLSGPYVSKVEVGPNGVVAATFTGDSNLAGKTLELAPIVGNDGALSWSCKGGTLPAEYRPPVCK